MVIATLTRLGTDAEGARLLVDSHDVQMIESFVISRQLEPLPRRKNGDVGDAVAPLTHTIASKGNRRLRREKIACNVCAETSRDGDDGRTIGSARIGIVHDDRSSGCKCLRNQLILSALRLPVVPNGVLADKVVRAGKAVAIER